MKVIPVNRQVNGKQVLVTDPQTGQFIEYGVAIDLDTVDFDKQLHYLRALEQGDLEVFVEPTNIKSKGSE